MRSVELQLDNWLGVTDTRFPGYLDGLEQLGGPVRFSIQDSLAFNTPDSLVFNILDSLEANIPDNLVFNTLDNPEDSIQDSLEASIPVNLADNIPDNSLEDNILAFKHLRSHSRSHPLKPLLLRMVLSRKLKNLAHQHLLEVVEEESIIQSDTT